MINERFATGRDWLDYKRRLDTQKAFLKKKYGAKKWQSELSGKLRFVCYNRRF